MASRRDTPSTTPARVPPSLHPCLGCHTASPAPVTPPGHSSRATPSQPPPQAPGNPSSALPSLWTQAERTRLGWGPKRHAGERRATPARASVTDLCGKAVKNTHFHPPGLAEGQRHRHPAEKRGQGGGGIPPPRGESTKSCGEGEGGGGGTRPPGPGQHPGPERPLTELGDVVGDGVVLLAPLQGGGRRTPVTLPVSGRSHRGARSRLERSRTREQRREKGAGPGAQRRRRRERGRGRRWARPRGGAAVTMGTGCGLSDGAKRGGEAQCGGKGGWEESLWRNTVRGVFDSQGTRAMPL